LHCLNWAVTKPPHGKNSPTDWLAKQIAAISKPVAIFSEFDDRALEVIYACVANNISVPGEAAVLGVDDDPLRCEFGPVPLSSIDDDQEMIGYKAAELLHSIMGGQPAPKDPILIPPRSVTTRTSTDILAVEHPLVTSALRIISEHYKEAISAKQVAANIPMSYRRLHDAFQRHVGHTMGAFITWKRLECAQRLLVDTRKKTSEIAVLSGFSNHDRMGKVFMRVLHVTPAAYRRRFHEYHREKQEKIAGDTR
jgi:LacI family transcriptional regulator